MNKRILWFLVVLVIWGTARCISFIYSDCMSSCVSEFKGAYPEIACKYECSFFNKFKKPSKRP